MDWGIVYLYIAWYDMRTASMAIGVRCPSAMYNLYTCIELLVLFHSLMAIVRKQVEKNVEIFDLVSNISQFHSSVIDHNDQFVVRFILYMS